MVRYVVDLREVDRTQVALAGGKGAQLAELGNVQGARVPAGFCVTTDAYQRVIARAPTMPEQLDRLSVLHPEDRAAVHALSAEVRRTIEAIVVDEALAAEIAGALARLGADVACSVRSSATAEDLPTASFAGQHDTYLNVVGPVAVLEHVRRCWASLFTERAVGYRARNRVDHRLVRMAVVVQRMVDPRAAGTMFTADPVSGHRKVVTVEAGLGLGEAVVSGQMTPDVYRVQDGAVVARTVATKQVTIRAASAGGTEQRATEPGRGDQPALTDAEVVRLAQLGHRIEAHFGRPQDIEWCLADDGFHLLQSRPITTLFPVPVAEDDDNHVYVSVGHQQMMTDPLKPLGISLWKLTSPAPMREAGGRLFVDVTRHLASPRTRAAYLDAFARSDPLMGDALRTVVERGDFLPTLPDPGSGDPPFGGGHARAAVDPSLPDELIDSGQASIAALQRDIAQRSGPGLVDFVLTDIEELRKVLLDPRSQHVFRAAMEASLWLDEHLRAWLDETDAVDRLTRSVPRNVTSEMGLALLDVADAIRPHPKVVAHLERVDSDAFLDELPTVEGGREARDAIEAFLDRYGMRCVGEIDITRPRWRERPTLLVPTLLAHVRNLEAGAGRRLYREGLQAARDKEREVLARLRLLPDGDRKAHEVKQMIDRLRTYIGYREYPKYHMVSRYFVYKQSLLAEAGRLVDTGVLAEPEDVFYLTLPELRELLRTEQGQDRLIGRRRRAFESYRSLTPPRVLTSDGEVVTGTYRRHDVPPDALVGLPVSAGTVEGRARVVLDLGAADLAPGDILVTSYTDPSWTPAFVGVTGLVTEVGGLMTHGAVIAREYGLPAVVGVEHATRLIRDGQRIRVHGSDGYVQTLPELSERGSGSSARPPGSARST